MRKKTYLFRVLFCFFYIGLFTLYSRYSFAYERVYYSEGMNGAVSCGHPLAAKTAIKILKDGGNAVDAAIAAAFVLGVVDFSNSGIGGEGFALIYHPSNKIIAIDGSTKRPASDVKNEYDCAIALPAIPEMLLKMRRLYGSKSAKELINPAIEICNKGFEVSNYLAWVISNSGNKIKDSNALRLIKPDGKPLNPADKRGIIFRY